MDISTEDAPQRRAGGGGATDANGQPLCSPNEEQFYGQRNGSGSINSTSRWRYPANFDDAAPDMSSSSRKKSSKKKKEKKEKKEKPAKVKVAKEKAAPRANKGKGKGKKKKDDSDDEASDHYSDEDD